MKFEKISIIILCSMCFSAWASAQSSFFYVANNGNNTISKVSDTGSVFFYADVNAPVGLAVNSSGDLFVTNDGPGTITEITPSGNVSTYATGLSRPQQIAFDTSGNLYVSSGGGIDEITPQGNVSVFAPASDFGTGAFGLAFNSTGTLYVTGGISAGGSGVYEVSPSGNVTLFASGFTSANGLAFSPSGELYVSDYIGTVSTVSATGNVSLFASVTAPSIDLAFDSVGNLYVTDGQYGGGIISEVTPEGNVSTFATGFDSPLGLTVYPITAIPEPATWSLSMGILGLSGAVGWKKILRKTWMTRL